MFLWLVLLQVLFLSTLAVGFLQPSQPSVLRSRFEKVRKHTLSVQKHAFSSTIVSFLSRYTHTHDRPPATMKPAVLLALLFVSCVAAQQPTAPPTTPVTKQLPAFTNITSCVPLNILITPSDDGAHTLSVAGTPDAHGALTATVVNSTLFLGFNRSFESTQPIRITVSLPADKLSAVEGSMGYVIVNPGTFVCVGRGSHLQRQRCSSNSLEGLEVLHDASACCKE